MLQKKFSFEETKTSAFIADQLHSFGIKLRTNMGGKGMLYKSTDPRCDAYNDHRAAFLAVARVLSHNVVR
ncbi:hypothetical protein BK143_17755 [Paenibacillus peoriae]|nr:hypothetical protein BK143_17755 [Paenibacillus peoriae]OMF81281.1 hypothetical protein BK145_07630 [Paenibacillus peoriae]